MDSASGSLQSSSGGEEEYDSRAAVDSVSPFMSTGGGGGSIPNAPPHQQAFFDPFSNYLQLQNPSPALSWPRSTFMPSFQPPPTTAGAETHHLSTLPPPPQNQPHTAARNPKKRSRASRRAPTTVLTTDTSNFRAMVQEFTGIPAPPFTAAPFHSHHRRLDLFGNRSASASAPQPPPPSQYLRRPFPQKPHPTPLPFLASSFNSGGGIALDAAAMAAAASSSTGDNNNITNSVSSSPAINNNLFTISNPLLTSFLQNNPKFQNNPPLMSSSKTQNTFDIEIPSNAHQSQAKFMGFDEQFGLSHENHVPDQSVTVLPNLINSDQSNSNNPDHGDTSINLSSINGGGYNFVQRNSTNFHGEKGADNGGRGEGMVESWICSSE